MEYKEYINSLDEENNVVDIAIRGEITDNGGFGENYVNGYTVAEAIGFYSNRGFHVNLNINSVGGAVMPTLSIVSQIEKHSVDTFIEGVAFSSAGLIAMSGAKRTMADFSMLMVHSVRLSNGKKANEAEKSAIQAFNNTITNIITNRSSMNEVQVSEMVNGGKDVFIDASKALELCMVDEVIETGLKPIEETASIVDMYNCALELTKVNNKSELKMEFENLYKEEREMRSTLQNRFEALEVSNKATLEANESLEKEVKELREQNEALSKTVNEAKESEATAYLNSKNIKLEGESLSMFINMFKENKEGAIGFIDAMPLSAPKNLAKEVKPDGETTVVNEVEKLKHYTTREGSQELMDMCLNPETKSEGESIQNKIIEFTKLGKL